MEEGQNKFCSGLEMFLEGWRLKKGGHRKSFLFLFKPEVGTAQLSIIRVVFLVQQICCLCRAHQPQ